MICKVQFNGGNKRNFAKNGSEEKTLIFGVYVEGIRIISLIGVWESNYFLDSLKRLLLNFEICWTN
jgi:hypothetical protein